MDEVKIIKKIRKGDTQALDSLIKELYPSIYTFVYRKMSGNDNAKDITQEVFIRFLRVLPTYHPQGKLLHYLYRIASHVCMDYFRKEQRLKYQVVLDEVHTEFLEYSFEETILNRMHQKQLFQCMANLTQAQSNVILLKYFHQLTFQEIADMYQVPLSTIKSRHTQALKKLKQHMQEEVQKNER